MRSSPTPSTPPIRPSLPRGFALLGAVWRQRFDPGINIVAVTVSRLRAKVDRAFARPLIHAVDGGYMLSDAVAVAARGS
jgi:hypothetical protein